MKISIITASYNYAQYIEEAINSVIGQSYQDWELIIVDDGSSDNSVDIIKSYCEKDGRIRLFQHKDAQNKGLKETLLLGISHATGDWIAFLESDDVFMPDNLRKKVEIIEEGNGKRGTGNGERNDEVGQALPERNKPIGLIFNKMSYLCESPESKNWIKSFDAKQCKLAKMNFPQNMFYQFYVRNMILSFSCVMVNAQTLKNADFDTPNDIMIDWWLWINLAYENDFYYLDEDLTTWRLHDKSYIQKNDYNTRYNLPRKAYFKRFQATMSPKILIFSIISELLIIAYALWRKVTNRTMQFNPKNGSNKGF